MGLFSSDDSGPSEADIACSPQGDYVTPARVAKITDVLDDNEDVHYLTRGSTVDVQEGGDNSSLFGDDRSRKSGTKGWVRAAFTDKRIVVKIPQMLGSDERSIPYQHITSVDLDTGMVKKRITLQTKGATYHIEADQPSKDEVRDATRFVRERLGQPNTPATEDSTDPLDQVEKLKDLHESGAISDEEFESKKSDLLDQL